MILAVGNRVRVETRIRVLGHPIHPVIAMFPLVLFVTSTVFDLARFIGGNKAFGEVAFWVVSAGIVGAALAGLTGFADWSRIPAGTRARRLGRRHGALNGAAFVLFVVAWLVRVGNERHIAGPASFGLQVFGVGLSISAAWLGGELVDRFGIGVAGDANPDAPNSLEGHPGGGKAPAAPAP